MEFLHAFAAFQMNLAWGVEELGPIAGPLVILAWGGVFLAIWALQRRRFTRVPPMAPFSEQAFFLHTSTFTIGIALIAGGQSYVAALGWILAIIGALFFLPGVDGPGGIAELSLFVLGISLFLFLSGLRVGSLQHLVPAWERPSDLKTGIAVFVWGQFFLFARDRWIVSRVKQTKGSGDPPTLAPIKRDAPNQLPDPTSPSVTPAAGAGGAPSVAADH